MVVSRSLVLPLLVVAAAVVSGGCASRTLLVEEAGAQAHTLRLSYNNVHVLVRGGQAVMIDAGLKADAPELDRRLRGVGVDPAKLRAIIVTHGHADHAGGARWFQQRYKVPVIAGRGDAPLLREGRNDTLCPTDDRGRSDLPKHQPARYDATEADRWVDKPLDLAEVAGIPGTILPMPGHTAGSLVVASGPWLFAGDTLRGAIVGSSAERHFYMCDLADNERDIAGLLARFPKATTWFVGHFGPLTRGAVQELVVRWRTARRSAGGVK